LLKLRDQLLLCRHLSASYGAGIPLVRCAELLGEHGATVALKRLGKRLRDRLQRGMTLGAAFQREKGNLPALISSMMVVGEETGRLAEVLHRLEKHYEVAMKLRGLLIRQLAYPVALVLAILIGIPMLKVVLEATAGDPQPLPHRLLLAVLPGLTFIITTWAIALAFQHFRPLRGAVASVGVHLWPFTRVWRRWALARVAWAMELTTAAGMPPEKVVNFAAYASADRRMRLALLSAVPMLARGAPLTEALAGTGQFSTRDLAFIAIGEEGGKLEEMFQRLGEMHYLDGVYAARNVLSVAGIAAFFAVVGWSIFW
jgi:type II secretory pathway component PulF